MIRSIALWLVMAPLALFAQSPPPVISTHILTFAPASLPGGFQTFYRTAGNIELFTASAGTLGLPTPYTGPRLFALYGSKADLEPPSPGQKPKPPVASVTLPINCDLVLLLCTRTADNKVGLVAYNLDSRDLKSGDYRVFNFSKSPVSMIMGDQRFALTPGKDSIVRDSKWHDETIVLPIKIATVADGKAKSVYSSFREHYSQSRTLMFLFDGKHPSRPITFATFNADTPAPKPAAGNPVTGTP